MQGAQVVKEYQPGPRRAFSWLRKRRHLKNFNPARCAKHAPDTLAGMPHCKNRRRHFIFFMKPSDERKRTMLQRSKSWLAVALMAAAAAAATAQTSMPASGEASAQASEQRANPREADRRADRRAERHAKRMADLKQRLQIISAQEGAWNQLVSAMQPPARQPEQGAGRNALERLTTPKRLDRMQAIQTERQNRMAARNQAIKQFYSQLSAEQQKVFDQQTARGHGPEHGPHKACGGKGHHGESHGGKR